MWRQITFIPRRVIGGFRAATSNDVSVVPEVFNDPNRLDEYIAKIDTKVPIDQKFRWGFHNLLRERIRSGQPFDSEIFDRISHTSKLISDNQWTYVIYRRLTLLAFLALSFWTASEIAFGKLDEKMMESVADLSQLVRLSIWGAITSTAALFIFWINSVIKHFYDSSITISTSHLAQSIQTYNNALYMDGFKYNMDAIDDEEALYGREGEESPWAQRAKMWTILAFKHYKRIEQTQRITENHVWESERRLRIVDIISRILNILMFSAFVFYSSQIFSSPQYETGTTSLSGYKFLIYAGLTALLSFVGWDYLGQEKQDIFNTSLLSEEKRNIWKRTANFRDELAQQVYKDKSKIQREKYGGPRYGTAPVSQSQSGND